MMDGWWGETSECGAPKSADVAARIRSHAVMRRGTPVREGKHISFGDIIGRKSVRKFIFADVISDHTANSGARRGLLRQEIIGHRMSTIRPGFRGRSGIHGALRKFPMLHQPSRQHGRCTFLYPLIHQRTNLLAQVGSVVQSAEFVAMETVV